MNNAGDLFIAEVLNTDPQRGFLNSDIRRLDHDGIIATIAGGGHRNGFGDDGIATQATLVGPYGVNVDREGRLFISDYANNRVRRVSVQGIVTTVAGWGIKGYTGDNGAATEAQLNGPTGVVFRAGDLLIADSHNNRIRKISGQGIINTIAGNGMGGYSGDGGLAVNAQLNGPQGLAIDNAGNLFIADAGNNCIRKVSVQGIITTVAGNGSVGHSGDGGAAINAQISGPQGLAVDNAGNLFIADAGNNRVRKVSSQGIITTVAGNGSEGYSGDGGAAINAQLNHPVGVAVSADGEVYVSDTGNDAIRLLRPATSETVLRTRLNQVTEHHLGDIQKGKDALAYVWIPPGGFQMGCSPGDLECSDPEKPSHDVVISKGLWMSQTPVTVEAYRRFV